jgi:hypothetical protein
MVTVVASDVPVASPDHSTNCQPGAGMAVSATCWPMK